LKRILITRPEPGATETADRLTILGFVPVVAPVLSIRFGKPTPPHRMAATVLTSKNSIPACPHSLHDRPVFTVGAATASAATRAGFLHVLSADGDAVLLSKLIADTLSPDAGALFLPTGEGRGQIWPRRCVGKAFALCAALRIGPSA
jgi:uroporphyrinogen-III synthase